MTAFKIGDRVVKYKRYSPEKYCRFGGYDINVPLGTVGTIDNLIRSNCVSVRFDTGYGWEVDPIELRHQNITWRGRLQ